MVVRHGRCGGQLPRAGLINRRNSEANRLRRCHGTLTGDDRTDNYVAGTTSTQKVHNRLRIALRGGLPTPPGACWAVLRSMPVRGSIGGFPRGVPGCSRGPLDEARPCFATKWPWRCLRVTRTTQRGAALGRPACEFGASGAALSKRLLRGARPPPGRPAPPLECRTAGSSQPSRQGRGSGVLAGGSSTGGRRTGPRPRRPTGVASQRQAPHLPLGGYAVSKSRSALRAPDCGAGPDLMTRPGQPLQR